jgi:hypothetical protein
MQADFPHTKVQGPVATLGALGSDAPRDYGTGRVCAICGKPINRYHADTICYPCEHNRTRGIIDRQQELSETALFVEKAFLSDEARPFFEPEAFQAWADTYYGSITRLANRAGISASTIGKQWRSGRLSERYSQAVRNVLLEGEA